MRPGVSLAGFTVAAKTTLGSQAGRPGLGSVWFAQMASYDALAVGLGGGPGRSPDLRRHRRRAR